MKNYLNLTLTILLTSCASASFQKELTKRGYSEEEKTLIKPHVENYNRQLAASRSSLFMINTQYDNSEQQMRNVFCNCFKKLGDKCRQKSDGLAEKDKQLWAKSNAAEMALKVQHNGDPLGLVGNVSELDPDTCQ